MTDYFNEKPPASKSHFAPDTLPSSPTPNATSPPSFLRMCHSHVIPCCFPFSLSVTCLLGTTSSTSKCLQRPLFCCLRLYMFAHVTMHLQPCTLVALIETQHHKVKPSVASVMSDSATLWNVARQAPLSVHGDSPGKNTAVGCHFLLQGIFPNPGIQPGSPALVRRFFTD